MAAPSPVGSPTSAGGGPSTSITCTAPAGITDGEYIVAVFRHQSNASSVDVTPPSGFTRISNPFVASQDAGRILGIFGKVATGSEPGTYAWATPHNQRSVVSMQRWTGVDPTNPVAGYSASYGGSSLTNGRTAPSFSVAGETSIIFLAASEFTEGQSHAPVTPPAGFTELASAQTGSGTSGSRTGLWAGWKQDTGTIAAASILFGGVAGPGAQMVALRAPSLDAPEITVTSKTDPTTPEGEDGTITISWDAVDGADSYEGFIGEGTVTTGFEATDMDITSPHVFTDRAAGTYTVAVRAVSD